MNAPPLRQVLGRCWRAALASPPVYPLLRRRANAVPAAANALTLLMYHTLGPDPQRMDAWTVVRQGDFLAHIRLLREHHDIVALDDALQPGAQGRSRPRAVLTFDDGNASLIPHLLPLLERERLPVTVYVATGHVESGEPYWFDALMAALQPPVQATFDLSAWGLGCYAIGHRDSAANWLRISALLEALKTLDPTARQAAVDQLLAQVGQPPGQAAVQALRPLTPEQVALLAASPWVTLGSHTHGHELLDQVPVATAMDSIQRSMHRLQDWTGRPVRHFAYPNGNHAPAVVEGLRQLGFASAVTTRHGRAAARGDRLRMPRVGIGRFDGLARFRLGLLAPVEPSDG